MRHRNLVDQISKNWNTQYLLLLKYKDHLQNAQYINKNQQDQDLYDTGIVDY